MIYIIIKNYTEEWNGFQIREPVYLNKHPDPNEFDIVKWEDHEPYEVTGLHTVKKIMSTKSCFSIGFLAWNEKECGFEFESCGLRYLEYRIDGLEKFILDFCEKMREKLESLSDMVEDR